MVLICEIPKWFEIVNEWWLDEIIDTPTFYNALTHLLNTLLAKCTEVTGLT